MNALRQPSTGNARRLRLVAPHAPAPVSAPSWSFVLRGAVTALVLGAVSLLAVLLTAAGA